MAFFNFTKTFSKMAENKTQPTKVHPLEFIDKVENPQKREDAKVLYKMMKEISGHEGKMWGPSIIGFGDYRYKYASGREGDWFYIGFSPRAQNMTIYLMDGAETYTALLDKMGKYKTGKSCLYIKSLDKIDINILNEVITESVTKFKNKYE